MAEKRLNTRIIHKHETEENWLKSSLVPLQGELIIYDKDSTHGYERIKVGDGTTEVNLLPFVDEYARIVHVGPDMPTDPNIKVWINTAEEGTGAVPVLPRVSTITLTASGWTGDKNPWSQVITVNGVTANSKIDPQPTAIQIVELQDAEITLMLQNDNGVVTAWAIGNKPTQDYTMDVLITEVVRV